LNYKLQITFQNHSITNYKLQSNVINYVIELHVINYYPTLPDTPGFGRVVSKYYVQNASASVGLLPPDPLPELCLCTTLGDFQSSDPPAPLAALSGNESLYFSLRLCLVTTYSWLDDTDKILVPICLYCLKCTKFAQFILRKIIKIVANRCQILRLKCTKFDFG